MTDNDEFVGWPGGVDDDEEVVYAYAPKKPDAE